MYLVFENMVERLLTKSAIYTMDLLKFGGIATFEQIAKKHGFKIS